MKKWYNVLAILMTMVIVLGMFGVACAEKPAPPKPTGPITINIGLPMPLSGSASPWGQIPTPFRDAWFEVFNREGFQVNGQTYKLKLIQVDDQNTAEGGAAAAKQLIYGDNCKFIAGHWSWNFGAVAAVTNPAKVIFVTRSGAPDGLPTSWGGAYDPQKMPYVVFGTPSFDEFVNYCFTIRNAYPNMKKLGLLDCTISKNGSGWQKVQDALTQAGVPWQEEWFTYGQTDFAPIITKFAEGGCDVVLIAGWIGEHMAFLKQRYEMGYKDMKVGCSGPFVSMDMYKAVVGAAAFEGAIGSYDDNSKLKITKVNPKYVAECQEALKIAAQNTKGPYEYTGEEKWIPTHPQILVQAMQQAGTVDDPDAIMKVIRGGTFDTAMGKWTMSGAKTYGSAVCYGNTGQMCIIKDGKEVYLAEHPMDPIP